MQANYKQRVRMRFGKEGPARYISHLDLSRTLERSLIRAGIPIAYTQGFNPRAKMQFADALPLGFTSECEIVDFWLKDEQIPEEISPAIKEKMAPGIIVKSIEEVELSAPALQTATVSAQYYVFLSEYIRPEVLEERAVTLREKPAIPMVRRGKSYDLRPLILELEVGRNMGSGIGLRMILSLAPGLVGRPDEVLKALEIDPLNARIHRTKLVLTETELSDEANS